MKKFKRIAFGILAILFMATKVNAETVSSWDELKVCLTTDGTATCETDVAITADNEKITVVGEKTLILGEKLTISQRFKLDNGTKLVVKGDVTTTGQFMFMAEAGSSLTLEEGTFTSTLRGRTQDAGMLVSAYGAATTGTSETKVIINKDVVFKDGGIAIYSDRTTGSAAYGVVIDVYGKISMTKNAETGVTYNVVTTNGGIKAKEGNDLPVINFYEGSSVTNEGAAAIYAAGYAIWNIKGGEFTGSEALSIKAGKFNITGGTFTANGTYVSKEDVLLNNGGNEDTGSAISITANSNYAKDVELNVQNATIESKNGYAIFEMITSGTISAVKDMTLTSGNYTGKVAAIYAENAKNFVEGGTYSTDVKDYVATGLVSKKVGDVYVVGTERTVNIGKVSGGSAAVDVTKAVVGETITITLTPNEGYLLDAVKVLDANNQEVTVTDNKFVMPDSNVTVSADFIKTTLTTEIPVVGETNEVGVKDAAKAEEVLLETLGASTDEKVKEAVKDTNVKVEVEIEDVVASESVTTDFEKVLADEKLNDAKVVNYFDITVAVKNANTGEEITTLPELTKAIELMIAVPELEEVKEGYVREYYIIREHDGKVELIKDVTLSEDGKYLVFESSEFSTYALAYNDVVDTKVPETGDNILYFVALGFMSIAAIGMAYNNLKKRANR